MASIVTQSDQNGPKWVQNGSKMGPKRVQNGSKMGPKRVQNGSKMGPKRGPKGGPKMGPPEVGTKKKSKNIFSLAPVDQKSHPCACFLGEKNIFENYFFWEKKSPYRGGWSPRGAAGGVVPQGGLQGGVVPQKKSSRKNLKKKKP